MLHVFVSIPIVFVHRVAFLRWCGFQSILSSIDRSFSSMQKRLTIPQTCLFLHKLLPFNKAESHESESDSESNPSVSSTPLCLDHEPLPPCLFELRSSSMMFAAIPWCFHKILGHCHVFVCHCHHCSFSMHVFSPCSVVLYRTRKMTKNYP